MQKYKSNITTTSGAAVRGVPVLVVKEDGNNAALFLDRAGTVPAPNPLTTGPDGVFYFYAVNGRYGLRTTVDGVTITDDDVVLMMDPEEIAVAGPIAEAVAAAQAAATAAELVVANSGIPVLVAAAQNAVVDSNNAVTQANSAANNAAISKTGADSARDEAVAAKNAAEAALDSFDDRYLGAKASAPATDNDGGALLTGALYWDTALPGMRSWNGSAWVTLPAATKASVGLAYVDNTSDVNKPISTATQNALYGKEPTIATGPVTQYWRGDKTWRDFFTDVRAATLTGLSTATNAVVAATDTVLAAIGKLQAQVSAKFDKTGGDVAGNINITGTARRITGDFSNATVASRVLFQTSTLNANTVVQALPNGSGPGSFFGALNSSDTSNFSRLLMGISQTSASIESHAQGTGGVLPLTFGTNNAERLRIDSSGNVLVTSPAGLGYGVGAGGTVVQATSKSTAVTLNKPTGQIAMNNSALGAGIAVVFQLTNSLISGVDTVQVATFGGGTSYLANCVSVSAGAALIRVVNNTGGSLSDALILNFAIIKGALS